MLLWACAGCDRKAETAATATSLPPAPSKPSFRLVAFTDLSGYLEPCGCQSTPLGGIDKAAAEIAAIKAQGVPLLVVSAGDLFFGDLPEGALSATDAQVQETWKAEALAGIFDRMGLAVAAPGAKDLTYGVDTLTRLAASGHYQLLPGRPDADPALEAVASTLEVVGDTKIGVVGASTFASPSVELERPRENALLQKTQAQVDALRGKGARWVVALISGTQRLGRRIAGGLRGVDFVVLGGLGEAEVPVPSRVGQAFVLRAARQGHGLLVVDVYASGDAPLGDDADHSVWTHTEASKDATARIDDLAARIAAWEKQPGIDKVNLEEQRARLAALRAEAAKKPSAAGSGSFFNARFVPLETGLPSDGQVRAAMDAYNARVNEHNKVAFADRLPKPPAPGAASFVGSERCKGCHAAAYTWWTGHKHGRAYATLEKLHKEFNLSCVGCHVTGYEQPGGSTVTHTTGLIHVGCESCHGAGSKHVAEPDEEPAIGMTRAPAAEVCTRCHSPEHSDKFEFDTYRDHLLAPGHGLPPMAAKPGGAP